MATVTFSAGNATASKNTSRKNANFALIGNFNGHGFRVISIHDRRELCDPQSVANSSFSDIRIAERID